MFGPMNVWGGKWKGIAGAVTCLLLAVVAISGCGGSGDETSTTLSRSEFLDQARVICKKGFEAKNRALVAASEKLQNDKDGLTDRDKEMIVKKVIVPNLKSVGKDLEALSPPPTEEKRVKVMLARYDAGVATLEHANVKILDSIENPFLAYSRIAKEYGLAACNIGL